MQLKEEFRTYEALRREHDAQIVHIAMEAGLRISPEQWSSLLYGDLVHKSHMQSIIDKVPECFTVYGYVMSALAWVKRSNINNQMVECKLGICCNDWSCIIQKPEEEGERPRT